MEVNKNKLRGRCFLSFLQEKESLGCPAGNTMKKGARQAADSANELGRQTHSQSWNFQSFALSLLLFSLWKPPSNCSINVC